MILPLFAGLDRIPAATLEAARDLGASRWETFRRVTWPMSRPAVVVSLLVTSLPMLGDYFTNDLLSASPDTSMVGNLINNSVLTPGQTGQAGAFVLLILLVSIVPMVVYVRSTRAGDGRAVVTRPASAGGATRGASRGGCSSSRCSTSPGRCCRCWSPCCSRSTPAGRARPGRGSRRGGTTATRCARSGTTPSLHTALIHTLWLGVRRDRGHDPARGGDGARPGPLARPAAGRRQPRGAGVVRAARDPARGVAAVRRDGADHPAAARARPAR